jgi:hypothetical protein
MPRITLTAEDKLKAANDKRDRKVRALIESKMTEYNISVETLEKTLGLGRGSTYYRLRQPSERLSLNEFALLVGLLRISNEELCKALRGGERDE